LYRAGTLLCIVLFSVLASEADEVHSLRTHDHLEMQT
jgi:hypothetical protein